MFLLYAVKSLTLRRLLMVAVVGLMGVSTLSFAVEHPKGWDETPMNVKEAYLIDTSIQTVWRLINDYDRSSYSDSIYTASNVFNLRTGRNPKHFTTHALDDTPSLSPEYHVQVRELLQRFSSGTPKDKKAYYEFDDVYRVRILKQIPNDNMLRFVSGVYSFSNCWNEWYIKRRSRSDHRAMIKRIEKRFIHAIFLSSFDIDYNLAPPDEPLFADEAVQVTAEQKRKQELLDTAEQATELYMAASTTNEKRKEMMEVVISAVKKMKQQLEAQNLNTRYPPEGIRDPSHPWYRLRVIKAGIEKLLDHHTETYKGLSRFSEKKALFAKKKLIAPLYQLKVREGE